jgi:hypothetical protein
MTGWRLGPAQLSRGQRRQSLLSAGVRGSAGVGGVAQERHRHRTTRPPSGNSPYENARKPRERDDPARRIVCPHEYTHTQGDAR